MSKVRLLNVCLQKQTTLRTLRAKISFNKIFLLKKCFEMKMRFLQKLSQSIQLSMLENTNEKEKN